MRKSDKNTINVGDIVRHENSDLPLGVVTAINKVGNTWVLDGYGFSEVYYLSDLVKTGKRVNVNKILKKLGKPFGDL